MNRSTGHHRPHNRYFCVLELTDAASDIERHAKEIISLRSRLNEIYVNHTGKDLKTIEAALDRDTFMTSDDAKKFGLIDKVVQKRDTEEK